MKPKPKPIGQEVTWTDDKKYICIDRRCSRHGAFVMNMEKGTAEQMYDIRLEGHGRKFWTKIPMKITEGAK